MPTRSEVESAVIECVQGYPYTEDVTLESPLGTFFKEQDDIDKQQNKPIARVDLFLRDLKKKLKREIPVTRDDLLEISPPMFPKVKDLVEVIAADLVD